MALDIAAFLHRNQKKHNILVIEAPVGTGKSLGALVPAMVEAKLERGFTHKRVVYATATINLQGQLMQEEVPLLRNFELINQAILAKGKAHYYCHKELSASDQIDERIHQKLSTFFAEARTGHRDEFESSHGDIENAIWDRVNLKATKRECDNCIYSLSCPSHTHRGRFMLDNNDLVITNHEQLIRSVLNRLQEPAFPPIVPIDPGIIVIDEAHHFQENFLSQLQETVTIRDLRAIAKHKRFPSSLRKKLLRLVGDLELKFHTEAMKIESLQGRYPLPDFVHPTLEDLHELIRESIDVIAIQDRQRATPWEREDEYVNRLELTLETLNHLQNSKRYVSWITYQDYELSSVPVNFPSRFKELLDFLTLRNKIIVMSGTLTTNGDFGSFLNQWRLTYDQVDVKAIKESFQYEKQALIYVPEGVQDPRDASKSWYEDQTQHTDNLLRLTGGRTLILSTSKQHMETMAEPLETICHSLGVTFLRQELGGVEQLTKQFKQDETSVLLGSGSFFSGFSVSGSSLVSVIFSRLPFPVPDDPYLKLIGAGFEDVFFEEIILPNMMTRLNQGVGRLIRDIKDFGIITILDPRVFDSEYGKFICSDLEQKGYRFTRSLEEVRHFYHQKLTAGSEARYDPYNRSYLTIHETLKEFGYGARVQAKPEKIKRPKKHKITEEQMIFAESICKEKNKKLTAKIKFAEDLYHFLVDLYYVEYSSITPIQAHFPYQNDEQREQLSKYLGSGVRTYRMKKCTFDVFGCEGQCSEHFRDELYNLVKNAGGHVEEIRPAEKFCWLMIKPFDQNDQIMETITARKQAAASIDKSLSQ
ncbi:3'-5' exonuclease DinG [Paenibacillus allorhizosphaerae]|uniref:3'-5' exonuclease DinG n=2 Tax=Paenibacillus allorhizosphaerae TaxID=2849866 RepID=A0ABM8VNQ3_9BACL|nr:3'-5' exonuclease DinG [Paenibacillus allorhizosphaerae]